jgi:ATP-dependent DNA helicase RecG
MLNDEQLEVLYKDLESDRIERKQAISEPGKIRQAICALANDMSGHGVTGVVFVGVADNGNCMNLPITDQLLLTLSDMRSDGNILPMPVMSVEKKVLGGCEVAVVQVEPSFYPPIRFKGRTWIRVGPRRATATAEEERRLNERRAAHNLPWDLQPINVAKLEDLDVDFFQRTYLPSAIAPDVLEQNGRTVEQQLASLRFLIGPDDVPSIVGIIALGKSPADFVPGAYVQFLRLDGTELTDDIIDQKDIHGPLSQVLTDIDAIMTANIRTATNIVAEVTEVRAPDYPIAALQQLVRNAIMHRDYQTSNAPTRVYWFSDRIEIQNPGGPYGQVTIEKFGQPGITDYRNPNVAEVMKTLGFVQRFGVGISVAKQQLADNGNPAPVFEVQPNHISVTIRSRA